MIEKK